MNSDTALFKLSFLFHVLALSLGTINTDYNAVGRPSQVWTLMEEGKKKSPVLVFRSSEQW